MSRATPPTSSPALGADPAAGPDWIRDAARQALGEVRGFLAAAFGFAFRPARFADEWYRGERHVMNPVGVFATAVAAQCLLQGALLRFLHAEDDESIFVQILQNVGPYVHYAALGCIAHVVLRLLGSTRSLRGSVGVALYAGTLPGLGGSIAILAGVALEERGNHHLPGAPYSAGVHPWFAALVFGVFIAFGGAVCAGLAGLHRVRWWSSLLAFVAALLVTGLFFGVCPINGVCGLHLALSVWENGHFTMHWGLFL